jgi:hypothetical protein
VGTYVAANRECKELLACISNAEAKIHELVAQKKEAVKAKDEEEAGDTVICDDADGPVNLSEILKNVSSEDLLDLLKDRFQRATKDFDLTQSVDVPVARRAVRRVSRHVTPMPRIVCHAVRTVRGAANTKSFQRAIFQQNRQVDLDKKG